MEQERRNHNRLFVAVEAIKNAVGVELIAPTEVRAESALPPGYENTPEKETYIREQASELGIGREEDLTLEMAGLPEDAKLIIEGGQGHKMVAELLLALSNGEGPIVMSASRHRKITNPAEITTTAKILSISESAVGKTEYEVAMQVAAECGLSITGGDAVETTFVPDIAKGLLPDSAEQGKVRLIGSINGREIYAFDVPREYFENENGETKYRQPNTAEILVELSKEATPAIAIVTSATYFPSRALDCDIAIEHGVNAGILAYGTKSLAKVKGEKEPTPPSIGQILAEVQKVGAKLAY